MSLPEEVYYTPEEYLALEREAECKSEYLDGQIYGMSGATRLHNFIEGDIFGELRTQLRGGPCEFYNLDMRVKVSATGLYTYTDIVVACKGVLFEDSAIDTLLNPVVIIEVLSPSTESYDRGKKFGHYKRLDSMREYVSVTQDRVRVEHFVRDDQENWPVIEITDLDDVLRLESIGCEVSLREIYARVDIAQPSGRIPI